MSQKALNPHPHKVIVARSLRDRIRALPPGTVVPTVRELMAEYEVSQGTVVAALDRIRQERLIHRPNGRKRLVVSPGADAVRWRIMIIRPDYPAQELEAVVNTVIEAGRQHEWSCSVTSYHSLETLDLERAIADADAAFLIPNPQRAPDRLINELARPRWPLVVLGDPPGGIDVPCVSVANEEAGGLLAKHLYELGHRKIGILQAQPPGNELRGRIRGFTQVLGQSGIHLDEACHIDAHLRPGSHALRAAYATLNRWMDAPHPEITALFCESWPGAIAALRVFYERKIRVPDDITLVAFSGKFDLTEFLTPAVTATQIEVDDYQIALANTFRQAVDGLSVATVVRPRLVIRETSASPSIAHGR